MIRYFSCLTLGLIMCLAACSNAQTSTSQESTKGAPAQTPVSTSAPRNDHQLAKTVHAYTDAFNARDINAMMEIAHGNIDWLAVDGSKILVEAGGSEALRQNMEDYFKSCPTCRARLLWTKATDQRLIALEEASWDDDSVRRAQKSLSVYEFEDGKIRRVYYYPTE